MKKSTTQHFREISLGHRGMASIEMIPFFFIFVFLLLFGLGFFGIVHTAILNSIGARAYAFETFRNRTNLTYLRENGGALQGEIHSYRTIGVRHHFIQTSLDEDGPPRPATRNLAFGQGIDEALGQDIADHEGIYNLDVRNRKEIDPVWVKVGYGLCLNASCGQSEMPP